MPCERSSLRPMDETTRNGLEILRHVQSPMFTSTHVTTSPRYFPPFGRICRGGGCRSNSQTKQSRPGNEIPLALLCEVKGQLGSRRPDMAGVRKRRISEKGLHGARGGRSRAVRRVGGCGDGGMVMVLDIFTAVWTVCPMTSLHG